MTGKVLWFSGKRGYGFIHGDDGNDYYAHITAVNGSKRSAKYLVREQSVEFDIGDGGEGKGAVALNITPGAKPPRIRKPKAQADAS